MNVPQLRFKEFSGEWATNKKLGSYLDFLQSGKSKEKLDDGEFLFYGSTGVIGYTNIPDYSGAYLLVARVGANAGSLYAVDGNFSVSDNTLILKISEKNNFEFFKSLLENFNINKLVFGSGQPLVTGGHLKEINVNVPTLPEQTKIANFLTTIDERINQLTHKKELMTQYKQGVMQQIFSQQLRFKDDNGEDFGDWEEKKLGELCKITTGKLDANAMVAGGKYRFYTCAKDFYHIDKYAFDTNALLISGNGANVGKFNAYQRTYVLDGFNDNIIFVKFYLDLKLSARIATEKKEGNTPYIVMNTLTDMPIFLPCIPEQTKIAHFLTALDEKIQHITQQIEATKQYKQGLLQQMFV